MHVNRTEARIPPTPFDTDQIGADMRIALTYQAAMTRLAELSGPDYPPHVQVKAVSRIATELSPNNPRHSDVVRAPYTEESPYELAQAPFLEPGQHPYSALLTADLDLEDTEEAAAPDDDDPL